MDEKISWHNSSFDDADAVIFGVPDESHSHSLRKGTSDAPEQIRKISNLRDMYHRNNEIRALPLSGIKKNVTDIGDVSRDAVEQTVEKITTSSKIPIMIGGDHSISVSAIKSVSKIKGQLSLVYFDAHPDFVGSESNYYGSVFTDSLQFIEPSTSIQIGIRTPEQEEIDNLTKSGISVVSPYDIAKNGITKTIDSVLDRIGKNVYISFDMDAIDPAFAPGVSVPVPLGLNSVDAVMILQQVVKHGIVGMDLMEVCPAFDIKERTSHLASRMIGEVISSL